MSWLRDRLSPSRRAWRRWRDPIHAACPGYSDFRHWDFFRTVLKDPAVKRLCMLGVYQGRDIAYLHALARERRCPVEITGVDKFSDTPGDDWPQDKRALGWEQAGFGTPPSLALATSNLAKLGFEAGTSLVQGTAQEFLAVPGPPFDFIYIDVAHDYQTTRDTLRLALPRLGPAGLIGGDDFSDQGTWGVARAVRESFARFEVFSDWIWLARGGDYRGAA